MFTIDQTAQARTLIAVITAARAAVTDILLATVAVVTIVFVYPVTTFATACSGPYIQRHIGRIRVVSLKQSSNDQEEVRQATIYQCRTD
jgi:hypothetical protein